MKKELYKLANKLKIQESYESADRWDLCEASGAGQEQNFEDIEKEKYRRQIRYSIHKEKKSLWRKRLTAAAACLAFLTVLVCNSHVQTTIAKSFGSIQTFLGIPNDLSPYTEIINTSVSDNGYLATLEEVIIAEDKIAVSYTLQRENGKPFPCSRSLTAALYVDGEEIYSGTGFVNFVDQEHKIQGNEMTYFVPGIDLLEEKTYKLKIADYSGGKWEFQFEASGAELASDTKRIKLEKVFALPDGSSLKLHDLTVNNFEQRINYDKESSKKYYELKVQIVDDQGMEISFYEEWVGKTKSYLINDNLTDSFLTEPNTETATVRIMAAECDETYMQISEWEEVGEFTLDLLNVVE